MDHHNSYRRKNYTDGSIFVNIIPKKEVFKGKIIQKVQNMGIIA